MRHYLLKIIFLFSIIFLISSTLLAIGVEPLTLEFKGKPGETLDFKVSIRTVDKPGNVKLSLYKVIQLLDGRTEFEPVEASTYPPAGWFTFPSIVKVSPGTDTEVAGKIKIPHDAKGTNNMLLMVESDTDRTVVGGVTMMYRFGVTMNVKVDRLGIRPTAEITDLELAKSEKRVPVIKATVKNTSPLDYVTYAMATVRDSKKKLIQQVELRPDSFWANAKNTGNPIIYPYSQLLYTGKITEYLPAGDYELRLFYRFADKGQILQAKTFKVEEGEYLFPVAKMRNFNISPLEINFEGRPNAVSIKALKFENKLDKPVTVKMDAVEIDTNYVYSIYNNLKLELKGGSKFNIGPKQTIMKIITAKFPKDAKVQGNYGNIKIQVYSGDEKSTLVDEAVVKLAGIVAGDKKRSMEVVSLFGDSNGNNYVLSAVIKNTGNVLVRPKVKLLLRNKEQRVVGSAELMGGEEKLVVLPSTMATVTATTTNILKPGKYLAEIKITDGDNDLGMTEIPLNVK